MIISVSVTEKSFGDKSLYHDLDFTIQEGEKVGLIGRNGTGKSTLLNMISGEDHDYQGEITVKRDTVLIASRQEHHGLGDISVIDYIQADLPEFAHLHHIITNYPETMGSNEKKLQTYSDALERFNQLDYFQIEDAITQACETYQLDPAILDRPLASLSGGQTRLVELIKVQRARGDIALIDEPTNHMDMIAKRSFIDWLQAAREAVLVITHDRDVLQVVDRIIEIRDGKAYAFRGNYEQYLRTNKSAITAQVNEYDLSQRRIQNRKADVIRFRRLKERSRDPGTIKRFKSQEVRAEKELAELQTTKQPSFWIDRDSAADLNPKLTAAYGKYKAQNISLDTQSKTTRSANTLLDITNLSLGYGDTPLFQAVSFQLHEGDRLRLDGRNGVGKTTLVNAIMNQATGTKGSSTKFAGTIALERDLAIGRYEQEIDDRFLAMPLGQAIEHSLNERNEPISEQKVRQLLSNYLFNPQADYETPISRLSGGQKARFQLIRMLLGKPALLILDEPTNHLDLPSIEELEDALGRYHGAILFISHDSFFSNKIGGTRLSIVKAPETSIA